VSLECSNLLIGFDQYQDYTAATERSAVSRSTSASSFDISVCALLQLHTNSDSDDHMKKLASDKPFQLADGGHRLSVWGKVKVK
jgi:hypothetical protein